MFRGFNRLAGSLRVLGNIVLNGALIAARGRREGDGADAPDFGSAGPVFVRRAGERDTENRADVEPPQGEKHA